MQSEVQTTELKEMHPCENFSSSRRKPSEHYGKMTEFWKNWKSSQVFCSDENEVKRLSSELSLRAVVLQHGTTQNSTEQHRTAQGSTEQHSFILEGSNEALPSFNSMHSASE